MASNSVSMAVQRFGRRFGLRLRPETQRRLSFVVIIGGSTLLLLWLLYISVWQPLTQTLGLPPGVTAQDPAINTKLLQTVLQQKADRLQPFNSVFQPGWQQFFQPPHPSSSPTP